MSGSRARNSSSVKQISSFHSSGIQGAPQLQHVSNSFADVVDTSCTEGPCEDERLTDYTAVRKFMKSFHAFEA